MWTQTPDPLHSLVLSAAVASLPILLLFTLLLTRKVPGYVAVLVTLILTHALAVLVFGMPFLLATMAAVYGVMSGLFPIGWIVINAVFLYNISVKSGSFAIIRHSIEQITADRRLQALLIAFSFGAFLEGSAGFGAPVAITAGMLVGLGFEPLYAAGICLIANTAPVAFGGLGIAVYTAGHLTNIDPTILSKMIAHQLPFIAFIMPLWLVVIIAGWKGAKSVWPALLVAGGSYALTMFFTASFLGPSLPDVLSAIVSILCLIGLLRVWKPRAIWRFPHERHHAITEAKKRHYSLSTLIKAWTPMLLLIVFVTNWGSSGVQHLLQQVTITVPFTPLGVTYSFAWLGAAGTAILFAALGSAVLFGLSLPTVYGIAKETLHELTKPLVTIGSIVGFAYVSNFSGMSHALGNALTVTGHIFPLLSPFLGWLGVFITGSDTSSNALFSTIQAQTAKSLHLNPVLTVSSNTSGGVAAKMISPQSIAVAAAATKLTEKEGVLFRFTVLHSVGLVAIVCVLSYLQAYYLSWMVPAEKMATIGTSQYGLGIGDSILILVSLCVIVLIGSVAKRGILTD